MSFRTQYGLLMTYVVLFLGNTAYEIKCLFQMVGLVGIQQSLFNACYAGHWSYAKCVKKAAHFHNFCVVFM